MKPEVKKKWIKALRSGQFKQGQNYLRQREPRPTVDGNQDRFCCLGVLCQLYANDNKAEDKWEEKFARTFSFGGKTDAPPSEVLDWAGLELTENHYDISTLVGMNDNRGVSFDGIADYIEANL